MSEYKKYGLLGGKLGHSLSPAIHDFIFKYTGLAGEYGLYPMEPDKIQSFIMSLRGEGFAGINVTIPYKTQVMPMLDGISEEAEKIGAVNTILVRENSLEGHNTDYFGFEEMLSRVNIDVRGKKVMVLGAGGAAQTVFAYLKNSACADVMVASIFKEEDQEKFPEFTVVDYPEIKPRHGYDILINTTPVGMYPDVDKCLLSEDIIKGFSAVADVIYNPYKTKLLDIAERNGIAYTNGLYMLVAQAVKAQEIWNGIEIDGDIIHKIYNEIKVEFRHGN